jgi:multidrug efflux system membrane fusion protein
VYAYVVKEDNTVQIRPLKVGPTEGDRVQIVEGLTTNERVVVDGVDKLREGASVELIDAAARASNADGTRKLNRADHKESRRDASGAP